MLGNLTDRPVDLGKTRTTQGYTLMELLTAIAIVAILAALLVPVFAAAREKGRAATCIANERQLGLAMMCYVQDYDERFPNGILPTGATSFWVGEGWAGQCEPYLKNASVLDCPDDPTEVDPDDAGDNYVVSYGYNFNLVLGGGFYEVPTSHGQLIESVTAPERTIVLFEVSGVTANVMEPVEGATPGGWEGYYFSASGNGLDNRLYAYKTATTGPDNQYATGLLGGRPPQPPSQFHNKLGRHSGGSNFLLADGHVHWLLGSNVSSGLNAPAPDCNQDDIPPVAGCAIPAGELHAAGSLSTQAPFEATFSAK